VKRATKNMSDANNTSAEAAQAILQMERDIMAAIKNKDAATLEPMLADDFVYRTHFGANPTRENF
jgi:ketosteroid isomerase-like protein